MGPGGSRRCDLVLAGGDVKAAALVGAVTVIRERGYAVNRVAGTSSGSIIAALVAADVPSEEMVEVVLDLDFTEVADKWPLARRLPWRLGWIPTMLRHGGLYQGAFIESWLSAILTRRGIVSFDDFTPPLPAISTGSASPRDRLVVIAADITSGRLRRLPGDLEVYRPPAALTVAEAVRASTAVPFLFSPVRVTTDSGTHVLVDGGVASTVPVDTFDVPPDQAPRWPTFGITLGSSTAPGDIVNRTDGIWRFASAILATMRGFHDRLSLDSAAVRERVVSIPVDDVPRLRFAMTREAKLDLVHRGRAAAEQFFDGFDEKRHLQARAASAAAHGG